MASVTCASQGSCPSLRPVRLLHGELLLELVTLEREIFVEVIGWEEG